MYGIVFPGQGSQYVGMSESLINTSAVAKQTFEEASDVLSLNLMDIALKGPEEELKKTINTQPILLTASVAAYRALMDKGAQGPKAAAGHSVGEYAALVTSGVISFKAGVELTRLRGALMQKSVPLGVGGMLAILGLDNDEVIRLCEWAEKESGLTPLEPANFNSPGQVVVSGNAELITWVIENFAPEKIATDKNRIRLIPLNVSAPFHCSMMKTAQDEMGEALSHIEFKAPEFPVIQNLTGDMNTDPQIIKNQLIEQISKPVKWVSCMNTFKENGISFIGEFGPGNVLTGLAKKIDRGFFQVKPLNNEEDLDFFLEDLRSLDRATGQARA